MSRTSYSFAIFFSLFASVIAIYRTVIYLRAGDVVGNMGGLVKWSLFELGMSIVLTAMVLWYFHWKKYNTAFYVALATTIISLLQFTFYYRLLVTRDVTPSYLITTVLVLVSGLVYGAVLCFSKTRERLWLKGTGIFMVITGCWGLASLGVALTSLASRLDGTVQTMEIVGSLLATLIPLTIALNFINERKIAREEAEAESSTAILSLSAMIGCVLFLVFGISLFNESGAVSKNPDFVPESVKAVAEKFEAHFFVDSTGDTLRYRLMKPMDADSTKRYPMVVCLHGSSGCGKDNYKQVVTSWPSSVLSSDANREKYRSFLFVPQCPRNSGWGGFEGYPSIDSLLMLAVKSLVDEKNIDRNRIYVSGNSLGGYGSWHLIAHYPEVFAAAIPISGVGDAKSARRMNDVPVWAFHGDQDILVPVSGSRDVVDAMKAEGGTPRYTEFAGEGHNIWQQVTDTPELLDWLFSQRKNSTDSAAVSLK